MGGQVLKGASQAKSFNEWPENLNFFPKGHELYDPRHAIPVSEGIIETLSTDDQPKAISVWIDGGKAWVVDGDQTARAAIEKNIRAERDGLPKAKVWVKVRDFPTYADLLRFRRKANLHIESPPSVLALQALQMTKENLPEADILKFLHLHAPKQIENLLALGRLHPKVQKAVDAGELAIKTAVRTFAEVAREDQPALLEQVLAQGAPKVEKREVVKEQPGVRRPRLHRIVTSVPNTATPTPATSVFIGTLEWVLGKRTDSEILRTLSASGHVPIAIADLIKAGK
jgi:hypothetical protein